MFMGSIATLLNLLSKICSLFMRSIVHALFIEPTITLFRKNKIKNESFSTIYTFNNHFATVFSIFSFQFQQK